MESIDGATGGLAHRNHPVQDLLDLGSSHHCPTLSRDPIHGTTNHHWRGKTRETNGVAELLEIPLFMAAPTKERHSQDNAHTC